MKIMANEKPNCGFFFLLCKATFSHTYVHYDDTSNTLFYHCYTATHIHQNVFHTQYFIIAKYRMTIV